jgi:hypothetical protein
MDNPISVMATAILGLVANISFVSNKPPAHPAERQKPGPRTAQPGKMLHPRDFRERLYLSPEELE